MTFDEEKWDAYLAKTYRAIEDAFTNASSKMIAYEHGGGTTASEALTQFVIDNDCLFDELMKVLRNSNADEIIALRRKAGTMWAEKYCEVQAIFDEKQEIENDKDY